MSAGTGFAKASFAAQWGWWNPSSCHQKPSKCWKPDSWYGKNIHVPTKRSSAPHGKVRFLRGYPGIQNSTGRLFLLCTKSILIAGLPLDIVSISTQGYLYPKGCFLQMMDYLQEIDIRRRHSRSILGNCRYLMLCVHLVAYVSLHSGLQSKLGSLPKSLPNDPRIFQNSNISLIYITYQTTHLSSAS